MPIANSLTVVKQTLYTLTAIRINFETHTLTAQYMVNIDGTDMNKIEIEYTGQDWDDFFTGVPDPVTAVMAYPIGYRFAVQLEKDLVKKKKVLGAAV
jgi:hypothetical protein